MYIPTENDIRALAASREFFRRCRPLAVRSRGAFAYDYDAKHLIEAWARRRGNPVYVHRNVAADAAAMERIAVSRCRKYLALPDGAVRALLYGAWENNKQPQTADARRLAALLEA